MARRSTKIPDPRLIDPRNRVALSRQAMQALGVKPGDYITFEIEPGGSVRIVKLDITVAPARPYTPPPKVRWPPPRS